MGWLFKKKKDSNLNIAQLEDGVFGSPSDGAVIPLEEVEDQTFSQKLVGDGIAVEPEADCIYSPCEGKIEMVFPTGHAMGITTREGVSLILHIGIDTVELGGKGFSTCVKEGDYVRAGQLVSKIDLDYIRSQRKATTMLVIEESEKYVIETIAGGKIKAGEPLIRIRERKL